MIKKILVFILLVSVFLISSTNLETKANQEYDLIWNYENLYSNFYRLTAEGYVPDEAKILNFYIAPSQYHIIEYGNVPSTITFFDIDYNVIDDIDLIQFTGTEIAGNLSINLFNLGIENVSVVQLNIMQTLQGSAPSGYVNYMLENSSYSVIFMYDTTVTWSNVNLTGNNYALTTTFIIPSNLTSFTILIPISIYHIENIQTIYNQLNFLDDSMGTVEGISLTSINGNIYGAFNVIISEYYNPPNEVYAINILIPQNYNILPPQYLTYMNENTILTYNDFYKTVIYWVYDVDDQEYIMTDLLYFNGNIPPKISDPASGVINQEFVYWLKYYNNFYIPYNFTPLLETDYINNTFNLYAYFKNTPPVISVDPPVITPITQESVLTLLNAVGFYNNGGFIITWILLTIGVSIFMVIKKLDVLAIFIVNLLFTSFFMFMGFLPVYVIILAFTVYFAGIAMVLRR